MLDFGKIIIYTSNLRIVRAPPRNPEALRHQTVPRVDFEGPPKARERPSRRRAKAPSTRDGEEREERQTSHTETEVMVLSQIILRGVVGFLSPHFCFLIFSLCPPPPPHPSFFCLYICLAIFSPLMCFQGDDRWIAILKSFKSGVFTQSPPCSLVTATLVGPLIFPFPCGLLLLLLQQPPPHCPRVIYQV